MVFLAPFFFSPKASLTRNFHPARSYATEPNTVGHLKMVIVINVQYVQPEADDLPLILNALEAQDFLNGHLVEIASAASHLGESSICITVWTVPRVMFGVERSLTLGLPFKSLWVNRITNAIGELIDKLWSHVVCW